MNGASDPPIRTVWVNDGLVPAGGPQLSATDHGLVVGDGVFEACKVVDSVPFALTRHLRRLHRSGEAMGLAPIDLEKVRRAVDAVLAANPTAFGKLRITVTDGPGPLGTARDAGSPQTLVVAVEQVAPPAEVTAAVVVPWTRNEHGALAGVKSTSYGENVRALAWAAARGAGEALFLNTVGHLCEGTGTNVFAVRADGRLVTPPLSDGPLAGITRELLLAWLPAAGVEVSEESCRAADLAAADEVFLTSSMRDVQAVGTLDGRALVAPGPVTQRVRGVWADRSDGVVDP